MDKVDEIRDLLRGLYVCRRVWNAWEIGTMTAEDFIQADCDGETVEEVTHKVGHLIAKRDAAIERAKAAEALIADLQAEAEAGVALVVSRAEAAEARPKQAPADLLARTMAMKGFHLNPGNREDWHFQFGLQEDLVVSMTLAAKYGDSPWEWHLLFRDWDPGKGIWRWKTASPLRFTNPVAAATYALRHILPQCR